MQAGETHGDTSDAAQAPPWLAGFDGLPVGAHPEAQVVEALADLWPPARWPWAPRNCIGLPVRPIRQTAALGAVEYEQLIARTGELPTRDNAHDWYNALVWLAFAQTKQMLNRLQVAHAPVSVAGAVPQGNGRTPRRNALTLFDENGAVVLTCDRSVPDRLRQHAWTDLFVSGRSQWLRDVRVLVIGHALLEKLEQPRIDLCAHARVLVVPRWLLDPPRIADSCRVWRSGIDACLAGDIQRHLLCTSDLQPLPLMGIPGWDVRNENSDFYNNTAVFRPPRGRVS